MIDFTSWLINYGYSVHTDVAIRPTWMMLKFGDRDRKQNCKDGRWHETLKRRQSRGKQANDEFCDLPAADGADASCCCCCCCCWLTSDKRITADMYTASEHTGQRHPKHCVTETQRNILCNRPECEKTKRLPAMLYRVEVCSLNKIRCSLL